MAWLTGWTYRKAITLSRASGATNNYIMTLLVGESSGASGEDVDCGAKCATDFDDLRFTADDGETLCNYWIESISGVTPNQLAKVHIKFPTIGTEATTFYMYYGNSGASAYSSGADTFEFFDDFPGDSLDTDKWDVKAGDVSVSGGELILSGTTGTRGLIESKTGFTTGRAWFARFKTAANKTAGNHISFRQTGDWNNRAADYFGDALTTSPNKCYFATYRDGSSTTTTAISVTNAEQFAVWRGTWEENKSILRQGTTDLVTHTTNVAGGTQYLTLFETIVNNINLYIDWIYVVPYLATEPAWGSWGSEETVSAGSLSLKNVFGRPFRGCFR